MDDIIAIKKNLVLEEIDLANPRIVPIKMEVNSEDLFQMVEFGQIQSGQDFIIFGCELNQYMESLKSDQNFPIVFAKEEDRNGNVTYIFAPYEMFDMRCTDIQQTINYCLESRHVFNKYVEGCASMGG